MKYKQFQLKAKFNKEIGYYEGRIIALDNSHPEEMIFGRSKVEIGDNFVSLVDQLS